MEKQIKSKKYKRPILVLCVLCFVLSPLFLSLVLLPNAYAEETQYSGVLEDLQKDDNFNVSDYPDNKDDYSIQVIQLAESSNKELFLYTYQPSQKTTPFTATDINMSLSETVDGTEPYGLTLLNCDGVFCKYKVNDYTVPDKPVRYYNITSIHRPWQNGIDTETGNDNEKKEIGLKVGQLWTVTTVNSEINYSMRIIDVAELLNLYAGSIRYLTGHNFYGDDACDIFYVAFTPNHKIDELKEVDVDFSYYEYLYDTSIPSDKPLKIPQTDVHEIAYLKAEATTEYGGYSWKWIQNSSDFLKAESSNLSNSAKEKIKKEKYVLLYFGCKVSITQIGPTLRPTGYTYRGYTTEAVSILRLKFDYQGESYNLGVVSDKVTGNGLPSNPDPSPDSFSLWEYIWNCLVNFFSGTADFWESFIAVMTIFVFAALLPILFLVLSLVFPAFGDVIKRILRVLVNCLVWALKGLWWLITLPFRGIAALVGLIKSKKDGSS